MSDEPLKTPRDELTKLIAVDGLSDTDLIMVALARVLKTQTEIKEIQSRLQAENELIRLHLAYSTRALAEIDAIYEHLQQMVSLERQGTNSFTQRSAPENARSTQSPLPPSPIWEWPSATSERLWSKARRRISFRSEMIWRPT
jgi:hypothetical protein